MHSTCIYSMILIFNLCANVLSHSKKTKKTTILRIYEGLGGIDSKIIALPELHKFYARLTSKSSFLSFCGGLCTFVLAWNFSVAWKNVCWFGELCVQNHACLASYESRSYKLDMIMPFWHIQLKFKMESSLLIVSYFILQWSLHLQNWNMRTYRWKHMYLQCKVCISIFFNAFRSRLSYILSKTASECKIPFFGDFVANSKPEWWYLWKKLAETQRCIFQLT